MTIYRLYAVTRGVIEDVAVTVWNGDREAIDNAKQWANGREIEIWDRDRLVIRIEPVGERSVE